MAVNKQFYVVDASVILKWFFFEKEKYREQALILRNHFFRREIILAIPKYAHAEVLNILGRQFSQDKALSAFSFLLTFELHEHHMTFTLASQAIKLMKDFPGISFYDAGYHGLALEKEGVFITADKKYYGKTRKAGHIMLLKDYGKKRYTAR